MKISLTRKLLLTVTDIVYKVVDEKTGQDSMAHITFIAEGGKIRLEAHNQLSSIIHYINGTVDEDGKFAILGKILKGILQKTDGDVIEFEPTPRVIHVICGKSKFHVPALDATQIQESKPLDNTTGSVILQNMEFIKATKDLMFAGDPNTPTETAKGYLLDVHDDFCSLVCSDTFTLAYAQLLHRKANEFNMIIPFPTMSVLTSILPVGEEEFFTINTDGNSLEVCVPDVIYTSRLRTGHYLPWKVLLEDDYKYTLTFLRSQMLDVAKRADIVTQYNGGDLNLKLSAKQVTVSGKSTKGISEEVIDAAFNGSNMSMLLDTKTLIRGLESMHGTNVSLYFNEIGKPIRVVGSDRPSEYFQIWAPKRM